MLSFRVGVPNRPVRQDMRDRPLVDADNTGDRVTRSAGQGVDHVVEISAARQCFRWDGTYFTGARATRRRRAGSSRTRRDHDQSSARLSSEDHEALSSSPRAPGTPSTRPPETSLHDAVGDIAPAAGRAFTSTRSRSRRRRWSSAASSRHPSSDNSTPPPGSRRGAPRHERRRPERQPGHVRGAHRECMAQGPGRNARKAATRT